MSKAVKEVITNEYRQRLDGLESAMVISVRGINGIRTTKLRNTLAKKKIRVTVVRNALASKALEGTPLAALESALRGASALAYGGESVIEVAREVVALLKDYPEIELKGAILDGQLFEGKKGVEELSKFPTRDEALGQVVSLIVGPARKLLAQVQGPGSTVAGIIKAIEGKLEKGEAIAKVA